MTPNKGHTAFPKRGGPILSCGSVPPQRKTKSIWKSRAIRSQKNWKNLFSGFLQFQEVQNGHVLIIIFKQI